MNNIFIVDEMFPYQLFSLQMEPLENKLEKEMMPGSNVVACRFPLPNLTPVLTLGEGVDTVWLYSFSSTSSDAS